MSVKFSELPALSTLTDEDIIALVHENTSYKATLEALAQLILADLSNEHPSINAVENAGNYIVAREADNGWTCEYYNSGLCKAWKTVNQVVNGATDRGSFLYKEGDLIAIPSKFTGVGHAWVQAGTAAGTTGPFFFASLIQKNTNGIKAAFIAPDWYTMVSVSTISVSYQIIGSYDRSIFS